MASLYDLELQESNNFIHALIGDGVTPALKLMEEQVTMAKSMGEAGVDLLKQLEDETSEMGKTMKRMKALSADIKAVMTQVGLDSGMATKANSVLTKGADSLSDLAEDDQKVVKDYWLKKKSIIVLLLQKGYTHEELFS